MSGRILIADDVATNRIVLKVKLTTACYDVVQAATVADVVECARQTLPDLILLGQTLQGGGGTEACRLLKSDPNTTNIPVTIISPINDRTDRITALTAGADEYLSKPLDESTLLAVVRNLMRSRVARDEYLRRQYLAEEMGFSEAATGFNRQVNIALVAPSLESGLLWRKALTQEMSQKVTVLTKAQALEDVRTTGTVPDVFVIAANLTEQGDGLRLVSELRSRISTRHSIIISINESRNNASTSMALDLGANAVQSGPYDAEELVARLNTQIPRKLLSDRMRSTVDKRLSMAMTDPLTGLYNRRYATSYLRRLETQAQSERKPYALMLLDLDRFKSVNDRFGHFAGDEVLVEVARRLRENLRETDLLARFGGEEFLIAMPNADHNMASTMAERLRQIIGDTPVKSTSAGTDIHVTMSIGVAVAQTPSTINEPLQDLLQNADRALYASKADGRNQVTFVQTAA